MQEDLTSQQLGAYVLSIKLQRSFCGKVGALGDVDLSPGHYFYFGSARGPGGLAARLSRHVRMKKTIHWHVDHLTTFGQVTEILAVEGGDECDLRHLAMQLNSISVPVTGFGSSDCPRCPAHLLASEEEASETLFLLAGKTGGRLYSAESFLPITAAQPSTV